MRIGGHGRLPGDQDQWAQTGRGDCSGDNAINVLICDDLTSEGNPIKQVSSQNEEFIHKFLIRVLTKFTSSHAAMV